MESEGAHIEKPDWREEFEREVIKRSGISDEEEVRKKHGEYEPPAHRIQEARERDEHMITSRELLDLHVLQAKVKQEHQGALEPYYEELLSRAVEKIEWSLTRLLLRERKDRAFYERGEGPMTPYELMQRDMAPKLELLLEKLKSVPSRNRMMLVDEVVNSMHIYGPLGRYIVRDFADLTDPEIKKFFDILREY